MSGTFRPALSPPSKAVWSSTKTPNAAARLAVISTEPVKGWACRGSVANRTPKYQSPAPTAVNSIAATRADSEAMAMKASTANPSWKMANSPSHFNNAARKRPEDS